MLLKFLALVFLIMRNGGASSWEARTMTCDSGRPLKCRVTDKTGHTLDGRGCRLEDVPLDQQRLYLQSESDEAKNFTTTSMLLVDGSQQPSLASSLPKRLACALNVRGAVKSSASIKMPLKAVQCVRYYTYNDYLDENEDRAVDPSSGKVFKPDWYMWIKEPCQNVSVTIWYYFPDDE